MAAEFVDKADYLEALEEKRRAVENAQRLHKENEELKKNARRDAEDTLTAQLVSRFTKCVPEYPGYDGLTEVELPDGRGKVQINVSNQEPGSVHIRVWGPDEKDESDPYSTGFREDFRCTFRLTDEGAAVESIDFHRRFR